MTNDETRQAYSRDQALHFLDSIIESLPSMVFVKDAATLKFVRFNKAGEKLLGIPRVDMIGKSDFDFFPKEQAEFFQEKDRAVLESKQVLDIPEEPIDTPRGKRWLHTKKFTLYDLDGRPAFLLGVSEDITEQREIEREKDQLISIASHELRSPANAILGSLEALRELLGSRSYEDAEEPLSLALQNAERLTSVLDECLDVETLSQGSGNGHRGEFDLAELIRDAIRLNQPFAQRVAARLEFHDPKEPAKAFGDKQSLMRAITNLLTNAAKFTRKGTSVAVSLSGEGAHYLVSVEDSGPGIPENFRGMLFKRFARSRSAETSAMEGAGLGLAITKKIIESHGGRIGFRSELARGTTFYFTIPKS
jgi:PAS domain S-box-containing protein